MIITKFDFSVSASRMQNFLATQRAVRRAGVNRLMRTTWPIHFLKFRRLFRLENFQAVYNVKICSELELVISIRAVLTPVLTVRWKVFTLSTFKKWQYKIKMDIDVTKMHHVILARSSNLQFGFLVLKL